jgi:hypothetical protein
MVRNVKILSLLILMIVFSLFFSCVRKDIKKTVDIYANVNTMIVTSAEVTKDLCTTNTIPANKCIIIAQMYDQYVKIDNAFNEGLVAYLEAIKLRMSVDGQKQLEELVEIKIKETLANLDVVQQNRALLMADLVKLFLEIGTWKGTLQ